MIRNSGLRDHSLSYFEEYWSFSIYLYWDIVIRFLLHLAIFQKFIFLLDVHSVRQKFLSNLRILGSITYIFPLDFFICEYYHCFSWDRKAICSSSTFTLTSAPNPLCYSGIDLEFLYPYDRFTSFPFFSILLPFCFIILFPG